MRQRLECTENKANQKNLIYYEQKKERRETPKVYKINKKIKRSAHPPRSHISTHKYEYDNGNDDNNEQQAAASKHQAVVTRITTKYPYTNTKQLTGL